VVNHHAVKGMNILYKWSHTSAPFHLFMMWFVIQQNDNLIFVGRERIRRN
jgi:hypothetical protein